MLKLSGVSSQALLEAFFRLCGVYSCTPLCIRLRLPGVSSLHLLLSTFWLLCVHAWKRSDLGCPRFQVATLVFFVYTSGFLVPNLEACVQGFLERSHVYRQRQIDVAYTAAVSIQTAWRALQARRLVQQMCTAHQHNLKAAAAAGRIQVRLFATAALSSMYVQQQTGKHA